jgi:DNA-binding response OmpR family regulator
LSNLERENYEVITIKTCEEALKHLYQGIDPVYIILDIMMPESDGWVIQGISDLHNVPIAFLTVPTIQMTSSAPGRWGR